jgi:hypothetical protein
MRVVRMSSEDGMSNRMDLIEELLRAVDGVEGDINDVENTAKHVLKYVCKDYSVEYDERNDTFDVGIYSVSCDNIHGIMYTVIRYAYEVDSISCDAGEPVCELISMLAGVVTEYYDSDYLETVNGVKYKIKEFLKPVCKAKIGLDNDASGEPDTVSLYVRCRGKEYELTLTSVTYDEVHDAEMVIGEEN